MKQEMRKGIIMAILAAVLYAVSSPFSKVLLNEMPPTLMAGFLYLGAGIGMSLIAVLRRVRQAEITEIHLSKAELPYRVDMVLFDIAAPICMLIGLSATTAALEIVFLKGIFSGIGSIVIGLVLGERLMNLWSVIAVMALGIVSYGLSIYFYVHAQRLLGAARTSAYYAVSPFIAAFLSILIFGQMPEVTYFIALMLMAVGAWYSSHDGIEE